MPRSIEITPAERLEYGCTPAHGAYNAYFAHIRKVDGGEAYEIKGVTVHSRKLAVRWLERRGFYVGAGHD